MRQIVVAVEAQSLLPPVALELGLVAELDGQTKAGKLLLPVQDMIEALVAEKHPGRELELHETPTTGHTQWLDALPVAAPQFLGAGTSL